MADIPNTDPPATAVCPWCSAAVTATATVCPSCGASLVSDGEPNVPGVTTVAPKSIVSERATSQPRSRLLSWISGEYPGDVSKAEAQAVAPPDTEVRREILRLEIEAEMAKLEAEANEIRADAAEAGRSIDLPEVAASGDPAAADANPAAAPDAAPEMGDAPETGDAAPVTGDAAPVTGDAAVLAVPVVDEPPA